jgi:hypothetical protein
MENYSMKSLFGTSIVVLALAFSQANAYAQ